MIVGRETAGWNTGNCRNTLSRIVNANASNMLPSIIDESFKRYSWHLLNKEGGQLRKKTSSWFQRFYADIAKRLNLPPDALLYQNLYAWDYNKKSPTTRKREEFAAVRQLSAQLGKSIKFAKPDAIVFAVGCNKINDDTIKQMFNEEFSGYETLEVVKGHYWHFVADGITCYRIAHPRTQISKHIMHRGITVDNLEKLFAT